ncbi:MAG: histidine kinase [Comamonadaceae bacterium]|nr:MAG: histidine kinase [Comamonadaceae bacterium]
MPFPLTASPAALRSGAVALPTGNSSWLGGKGLLTTAWLAAALGLLHYLLHTPAADIPTTTTLSALAWPAPAIGIALLWRRPLREWPYFLLAIGAALFMVGQLDWLPWSIDLLFAMLGLLAVGVGAWVAHHWVGSAAVPYSTRSLLRFVLLLPGALAALNALLTGGVLWWAVGADWLAQAGRIYAAQALAFMTVLPALLSATGRAPTPSRNTLVIGVAASASLVLALLPGMPEEAIRALLALTLAGAALRQTPVAVARLTAAIAVTLVAMTLMGLGPYVERNGVDVWGLQLDLIGLSLLSLGLAVALQERRRLAQQLEQTRRIEALGFLASGIAHDFNNLLGTIGACAEIAADQWQGEAPQPLKLVDTEVQRGREMTQQLLLAARQGDPQRSAVPVAALLAEVVTAAQALCPAHVRIELLQAPPAEVCMRANASQLRRAIHNLVRNATQAARSQVHLRAGVAMLPGREPMAFDAGVGELRHGPHVWIEISDDGPGIDAAHWAHLFDPFYSTRRGAGGTGLGLAIVAGVACGHDGSVGMQTHPGQGTCFRLSIPQVNPTR